MELEQLFFFNPDQERMRSGIRAAVEHYGRPQIVFRQKSLRIALGNAPEAQTLFALQDRFLRPRLAGCVVYLREHLDQLAVAHLAVAPDLVLASGNQSIPLAVELLTQVIQIARQIRGITRVTLPYGSSKSVMITV